MLEQDLQLVEVAFKKYYFDHFDLLLIPERSSEREFGYQKFNGGMNRHISIKSNEELRLMLITNIPSDVYCSNAYYSFPNLPMSEKDWKGADLIFDIDAKDLNLDCRQEHTCIKCISCDEVSALQLLGSRERNELVDYIMFRGAMPETFGMKKYKPERSSFADINEKGWRGRASKHIFGSKSNRSKTISEIIKNSDSYSIVQHRLDNLKDIIGVKIDPNVTIDIHRIFRLPGSLNSKSGMSKVLCENIDKFNPFQDSCFIDDEKTNVLANCPTQFTLKNRKFGPYTNEKVTIPKYAAIYLICKGLANTTLIQN